MMHTCSRYAAWDPHPPPPSIVFEAFAKWLQFLVQILLGKTRTGNINVRSVQGYLAHNPPPP